MRREANFAVTTQGSSLSTLFERAQGRKINQILHFGIVKWWLAFLRPMRYGLRRDLVSAALILVGAITLFLLIASFLKW